MSKLVFTAAQIEQIHREGEAAYPNECCGAILGLEEGETRRVDRLRPLSNRFEAGEQYHRFRVDPLELVRIEKEAGKAGMLVLGFYHSHPDHPAQPSEYDRSHAWPFYSYVIVSIMKRKAAEMTSWQLDPVTEKFQAEAISRV